MEWNEAQVEFLKRLWAEGWSASQIASRMDGEVSRNAIMGKVHRLDLPGRATRERAKKAGRGAPARQARSARQPRAWARTSAPASRAPKRSIATLALLDPAFESGRGGVTLAELEDRACRWPMGDPQDADFRFCGRPAVEGRSYCACCLRRAFRPWRRRSK